MILSIQVYLAAIKGLVPDDMVQCVREFVECCYIARRNAITSSDLDIFNQHLKRFHELRNVFIETSVRTSISLPRQHALMHYTSNIERFGSPNGVCSSITESTHITAVKEPWRRSSRNNPLPQMVQTISRLYKLNALRHVFENRGMLDGKLSDYARAFISGNLPPIRYYGAQRDDEKEDDDLDEENDSGPSPSAITNAQVTLAATKGEYSTWDSDYGADRHI
jgi:hypothetical protein